MTERDSPAGSLGFREVLNYPAIVIYKGVGDGEFMRLHIHILPCESTAFTLPQTSIVCQENCSIYLIPFKVRENLLLAE